MKLGTSVAVGNPYGSDKHDDMLAISASTLSECLQYIESTKPGCQDLTQD